MTSKFKVDIGNGKYSIIEGVDCTKETLKDLKERIHNKEGIELAKIDLLSGGISLSDDNKLLSEYDMGGSKFPILVTLAFKTRGGALQGETYDENNSHNKNIFSNFVPTPDFSHPKLKPTKEPCCLGMNGEEDEDNVKFSCGCVFSASALYGWANGQLKEETGFTKFNCPNGNCKGNHPEWSFSLVACAIGWNEAISEHYYAYYTKKQLDPKKYKQCPFCHSITLKDSNDKLLRRRCTNKFCPGKQDWCWDCIEPWISNNNNDCGNEACSIPRLNKILKECQEKKYVYPKNSVSPSVDMMLPEYRACINDKCRALICQPQQCNQITCDACKTNFCFICLKVWSCNEGRKNHEAHPRQVF